MPHRTRLVSARGRSVRRKSTWFEFADASTSQSAQGGNIVFSLNAAALALRPFTVVRTLFEMHVSSDQSAGGERQIGAIGIAIVSDEAVAVGVGAVPTPVTQLGSDLWFAHRYLMCSGSAVNDGVVGCPFSFDSKAMRKVDVGQDLVVVLERDLVLRILRIPLLPAGCLS